MTADKSYHIDVPAAAGMAGNLVVDCTNSKIGMGHLIIKNNINAASGPFAKWFYPSSKLILFSLQPKT